MRIALYVHCFFPLHFYGTEAYTLQLAKGLMAAGHEVVVVSAVMSGEPGQDSLVVDYVHEGVPVVSIDKNLYPNRRVRDTYEQPDLRTVHERILRKLRPDVVHVCHVMSHTTAVLDVTRKMDIPTFATLTDFFGFCYNNVLENAQGALCAGPDALRGNCIACFLKLAGARNGAPFLPRFAGLPYVRDVVAAGLARLGQGPDNAFTVAGFRPADIVARPDVLREAMDVYREAIAPTAFLKGAYERNAFPAAMRLSHFGVDIDRSSKPPRPEGAPVRIGFIGQIARHKGLHILIEAMRGADRPALQLTAWGSPDQDRAYFASLTKAAAGLGVAFPGTIPQAELAAALAGVDYLVIPSTWYENSPLILLQALATHTPVIVSDVPGMTEFVEDGVNGFRFERGNAASLAAVLRRVADAPDMASRMSARTRYERQPADMAADVLAMYGDHDLPWSAPPRPVPAATPSVSEDALARGIEGDLQPWLAFNTYGAFESEGGLARVAPFAPMALLTETTGLSREQDFASHGADLIRAMAAASDQPLHHYRSWLDFGVGVGRVARMFKGYTGDYAGVDVDPRAIAWLRQNLPWVHALRTVPRLRLPFRGGRFEAVVGISVFTHMNAEDQSFYLRELSRVTAPGASLFVTVHGERALQRALDEPAILSLLAIPHTEVERAARILKARDQVYFIRQAGHLTTEHYSYGISFNSARHINSVWSQWFDVISIDAGGIHDFQDVVTLRRREQ